MTPLRQATMSALNESLVLDYVREHEETSRPAIARDLGLSRASVSRIVGRLIQAELITESPQPADGRGRPAASLRFNTRAGCVLAIDLGRHQLPRGAGRPGGTCPGRGSARHEHPRRRPTRPSSRRSRICTAAASTPIVAAAIGVPAIVDPVRGHVLGGPNGPLARVRAARRAAPRPARSRHRSTTTSSWPRWPRPGVAWDAAWPDFATISIGTGVGAAIVANGELLRGPEQRCGRAGLPDRRPRPARRTARRRAWVVSSGSSPGPAIAARARHLLQGSGRARQPTGRGHGHAASGCSRRPSTATRSRAAGRRARSSMRSSSSSSPWRRPPTRRSSSSTAAWAARWRPTSSG